MKTYFSTLSADEKNAHILHAMERVQRAENDKRIALYNRSLATRNRIARLYRQGNRTIATIKIDWTRAGLVFAGMA